MSIFTRFIHERRGNVAMMFAIAMVPVIGAVGAAIDYARVSEVHRKLTDALDAGVLAVGSQPVMSDSDAFKQVDDWVSTHMGPQYAKYWKLDSVTQDDDGNITAVASGDVDTTIVNVLGITDVPIKVTSEAVRALDKVEVALVLDNTGSMKSNNKIGKLKDAAHALVDTLVKATKKPEDLKIGLVPFSQTVNVGPQYSNAAWLDAKGVSDSAKSLFLGQKVNRIDLFKQLGALWGGCVETREPAYEATDTEASDGTSNTLYVPYFAPDEPGSPGPGAYDNSYLPDTDLTVIKALLTALGLDNMLSLNDFRLFEGDVTKYNTTNWLKGQNKGNMKYQYGPNSGCEIAPLLRLTSDSDSVKTGIDKMIANGNTDIPIGTTWGWNVLAPDGPFGDGVPYKTEDWSKFAVIMTDGDNANATGNSENNSLYSGVGYVWQERIGVPANNNKESDRVKARDARLAEICANMKDKGIVIYTVRVEVKNGSSAVLKNCASSSDKFYDVQNVANLTAAFENIGNSISKLRLAK